MQNLHSEPFSYRDSYLLGQGKGHSHSVQSMCVLEIVYR